MQKRAMLVLTRSGGLVEECADLVAVSMLQSRLMYSCVRR